jgi:DNA-directed RNA polymerase II subunit RPB3
MILQQSIISLQRKLATTVSELSGEGENPMGAEDAEMMGANDPDAYEPPEGIDGNMTSYGNAAAGAWQSAQTPYGATPYGQTSYGF